MTGGTIAWGWGIIFAALCVATGITIGWPLGNRRGWKHAAEEAEWQRTDARWRGLADKLGAPAPVRPPATTETPHAGPGKHRHPPGSRHAALPVAGYLPAPGPWNGTLTVPAPAQPPPPWDAPPAQTQTEVLEPTAVLPGIPETDTAWTRRNCEELQEYIDQLIAQSGPALKEITS